MSKSLPCGAICWAKKRFSGRFQMAEENKSRLIHSGGWGVSISIEKIENLLTESGKVLRSISYAVWQGGKTVDNKVPQGLQTCMNLFVEHRDELHQLANFLLFPPHSSSSDVLFPGPAATLDVRGRRRKFSSQKPKNDKSFPSFSYWPS